MPNAEIIRARSRNRLNNRQPPFFFAPRQEFSRTQARRLSIAKVFLRGLSSDTREVQIFEPDDAIEVDQRSPVQKRIRRVVDIRR